MADKSRQSLAGLSQKMSARKRKSGAEKRILARERIADQLPAALVPSQWVLIEREFLLRPPYLPAYQAASLIEQGKPLYENREGFTQIFT